MPYDEEEDGNDDTITDDEEEEQDEISIVKNIFKILSWITSLIYFVASLAASLFCAVLVFDPKSVYAFETPKVIAVPFLVLASILCLVSLVGLFCLRTERRLIIMTVIVFSCLPLAVSISVLTLTEEKLNFYTEPVFTSLISSHYPLNNNTMDTLNYVHQHLHCCGLSGLEGKTEDFTIYNAYFDAVSSEQRWNYFHKADPKRFPLIMKGIKVPLSCCIAMNMNSTDLCIQNANAKNAYTEGCTTVLAKLFQAKKPRIKSIAGGIAAFLSVHILSLLVLEWMAEPESFENEPQSKLQKIFGWIGYFTLSCLCCTWLRESHTKQSIDQADANDQADAKV